jgi:hypothetical protein
MAALLTRQNKTIIKMVKRKEFAAGILIVIFQRGQKIQRMLPLVVGPALPPQRRRETEAQSK